MLSMVDNLSSFLDWLRSEMNKKGASPADISRTGYVTSSAVSLLFSMKTKSLSFEMAEAISAALNIPLETVYRKAKLLPPGNKDPWVEDMNHKINQLTGIRREIAERLLNSLAEEEAAEKIKGKNPAPR